MRVSLVTGIFLLLVATIISVSSLFVTEIICANVETSIDNIEELIIKGENEEALYQSQILTSDWEKYYKIASSYMPHDELERVEVSIFAVPKYLSLGDDLAALIICEDIKVAVNHIYLIEYPGFWNIF